VRIVLPYVLKKDQCAFTGLYFVSLTEDIYAYTVDIQTCVCPLPCAAGEQSLRGPSTSVMHILHMLQPGLSVQGHIPHAWTRKHDGDLWHERDEGSRTEVELHLLTGSGASHGVRSPGGQMPAVTTCHASDYGTPACDLKSHAGPAIWCLAASASTSKVGNNKGS